MNLIIKIKNEKEFTINIQFYIVEKKRVTIQPRTIRAESLLSLLGGGLLSWFLGLGGLLSWSLGSWLGGLLGWSGGLLWGGFLGGWSLGGYNIKVGKLI